MNFLQSHSFILTQPKILGQWKIVIAADELPLINFTRKTVAHWRAIHNIRHQPVGLIHWNTRSADDDEPEQINAKT